MQDLVEASRGPDGPPAGKLAGDVSGDLARGHTGSRGGLARAPGTRQVLAGRLASGLDQLTTDRSDPLPCGGLDLGANGLGGHRPFRLDGRQAQDVGHHEAAVHEGPGHLAGGRRVPAGASTFPRWSTS